MHEHGKYGTWSQVGRWRPPVSLAGQVSFLRYRRSLWGSAEGLGATARQSIRYCNIPAG